MPENQNVTPVRHHTLRRPADPELLSRGEAANFLGVSVSSLAHWANSDRGPPFTKLGKSTWYRTSDLQAWIASRLHTPTGA